ncbi:hypothetical protein OG21DRAFT_1517124 [Imleria badia]|nr:hypothetical protein OG21DRAFT_1517124 [Imleria badia]
MPATTIISALLATGTLSISATWRRAKLTLFPPSRRLITLVSAKCPDPSLGRYDMSRVVGGHALPNNDVRFRRDG